MQQPVSLRVQIWLALTSVLIAVLLGIGALKLYSLTCFYLSLPGGIVFVILIGGPHGGGNKVLDALAGTVGAIINAVVYFGILNVIIRMWRRRTETVTVSLKD
jgi:hypothetical protein